MNLSSGLSNNGGDCVKQPVPVQLSAFAVLLCLALTGCVSAVPQSPTERGANNSTLSKKSFGEPHPEAPPQLVEFGRFAGSWSCAVNERRADGSWRNRPDKINWTFFYTLNGMAVQDIWTSEDQNNTQEGIATNLRVYNSATQTWNTSWTNTLQASFELWTGGTINNELVLTSVRDRRPVKIRFFNILPRQFQWTYEAATTLSATEFMPVMQLLCQRQG